MSLLDSAKRIYLIGLKGAGMTALAQFLQARGQTVWGSDTPEKFFTDEVLKRSQIEVREGFAAAHLDRAIDLVIRSTAYGDDNIEVRAAQEKKLPIITYPEALGELTRQYKSLAVAGSHGKTTTAALLAHVLQTAGLAPSALVGSEVTQFKGNALIGAGELFVFEADEYQNKFQYYSPQSIILTSLDWDHPDFYKTPAAYEAAFVEFLKKLPADGLVVACYDDDNVKQAVAAANLKPEQVVTYGLTTGYWQLGRMWLEEGRWHFSVNQGEDYAGAFYWRLIGGHNVANALAVMACARRLGVDLEVIRQALMSFEGIKRRFEIKGKLNNQAILVDDYAHHPAEIVATLKAARAFYPYKNIRVVFHPHTFSRTEALLADFAASFAEADEVIVLDIYSSAREQSGGVSSADLVAEIKQRQPKVEYRPTVAAATDYLSETMGRSDLVITMGAGDVWKVGEELIKKFGLVTGSEF
ncbi:MAG: UDP-N-acetylmuramate--L-alanine ligase [Candidatus Kerfeldbacteria bacterium]|nr:UDP-N-acetylmuramate--L-alanine ligase [Candidatus Kerfeldbacteria bacterium]